MSPDAFGIAHKHTHTDTCMHTGHKWILLMSLYLCHSTVHDGKCCFVEGKNSSCGCQYARHFAAQLKYQQIHLFHLSHHIYVIIEPQSNVNVKSWVITRAMNIVVQLVIKRIKSNVKRLIFYFQFWLVYDAYVIMLTNRNDKIREKHEIRKTNQYTSN